MDLKYLKPDELLAKANSLLSRLITKGAPPEVNEEGGDPDARVQNASPEDTDLDEARQEAQAGQQASAAQGGGPEGGAPGGGPNPGDNTGHPEPDGDEDGGGNPDNDGDEQVAKAEVLGSLIHLAKSYDITPEEFAKSFSGLEGNPAVSPNPLGKGEAFLEEIVTGNKNNAKILEAIAESLALLMRSQAELQPQIAKALQTGDDARGLATSALDQLKNLPRTAPGNEPRAITVAKAAMPTAQPSISHEDLFQSILAGKMEPGVGVAANRELNQMLGTASSH
jgi:hypothetical protein